MPEITLGRTDILRLQKFCATHKTQWFVAKDQGAYIGASVGQVQQCIFYFRGCDPNKDKPFNVWYENCRRLFGGDDFGEMLPNEWLDKVVKDPTIVKMRVIVKANNIEAEFTRA